MDFLYRPMLLNTSKTSSVVRQKFEYNLEGLRGFAALIVVFHHAIYHKFSLDPDYAINGLWVNPLPGHTSVLLFFILSGYVIGLTNKNPIIISTIIPYLRKRLVRLYPIYVISILFTLLIVRNYPSAKTIIGNFLFLQTAMVPWIWENNPLWSLNSEVLYYLLFIPISYFKISPKWAFLISLSIGITCAKFFTLPLLTTYCLGFVFWTSGLWLAQSIRFTKQYVSNWSLAALLFLFLGYPYLNPFILGLYVLGTKFNFTFSYSDISVNDLMQLPFCFYIISRFTNRTTANNKRIMGYFIASSYLYYFYICIRYGFSHKFAIVMIMPISFFAIGTLLLVISYFRSKSNNESLLPNFLLKIGSISYGIYVIHFPISNALSRITIFSGSALTFWVRLLIDIILVLIASYLLEMKIQPWFRRRFSAENFRAPVSSNEVQKKSP
jgi:peptidoglycan/LPS O-acetylase OafA/YrhL